MYPVPKGERQSRSYKAQKHQEWEENFSRMFKGCKDWLGSGIEDKVEINYHVYTWYPKFYT